MDYNIGTQGWVCDPPGFKAYAASIAGDEPANFWSDAKELDEKITAMLGTQDRCWYRSLRNALVNAGQTDWLVKINGIWCIITMNQGSIGSCVSNAEAKRASYRAALDIYWDGQPEKWKGMFCRQWSYYASRKQSGMLRGGDGSTGYGAAKAATIDGMLVEGTYGGVNLTKYDVSQCRNFGYGRGVPQEAIAEAAKHKFETYVQIDTAEKAWIAAGIGLIINQCSNVGWENPRQDGNHRGIIKRRGSWGHSMCMGAARKVTPDGAKAIMIDQSWSTRQGTEYGVTFADWTTGPYCFSDAPRGSFMAYLDDIGLAVEQGDTFTDINYSGYAAENVPSDFVRI